MCTVSGEPVGQGLLALQSASPARMIRSCCLEIEETIGMKLPCEHPPKELLGKPPAFTRESKFKPEGKDKGGKGGGRKKYGLGA